MATTRHVAQVPLTPEEHRMTSEIVKNDNTVGLENITELFRMLLHREHCRRHNLPKPKAIRWQTAARTGSPVRKGTHEAKT